MDSPWQVAFGGGWTLRDDPEERSPILSVLGVEVALTKEQADLIRKADDPSYVIVKEVA